MIIFRRWRAVVVVAAAASLLLVAVPVLAGEDVGGSAVMHDVESNRSGVTGRIDFRDDGGTLRIEGTARGLDPDILYVSLIYDNASLDTGPEACEPAIFDPTDPDFILESMFVGEWTVDSNGNGTLSATNIIDDFGNVVYVPLDKFHTISIRDTTVPGPFGPGSGPAAVVACGVEVATEPDGVAVVDTDQGLWYLVAPVTADLTGAAEVPVPPGGDLGGEGRAVVTFNELGGKVCFDVHAFGLSSPVVAAHIHEAPVGVNGPIVVDFDWTTTQGEGCVSADSATIDKILADLAGFYVNVHTPDFPAGAVRGQLEGGPLAPFYFGNPGDTPFLGDWNGDGIDTPGLHRPSDGKVYLRNSNDQGIADIEFFFGNPGDVPLVGDFDGDGDDTVSLYRPSESTVYIINELGAGNEGLGAAEFSFVYGDPGDTPFVGDFDGDGIDTIGVRRNGVNYLRNSLTAGPADVVVPFGNDGEQPMAGDWDGNGDGTVGLWRSSDGTVLLRNRNTPGLSDMEIFTDGFESGDVSAWGTIE